MEVAIGGSTCLLGVFGDPVRHSLSPAMHNAALAHLGLDYAYVPFHVTPERLAAACEGLRALDIRGVNVTIPYKIAIAAHLDTLSPEAELTGAVNTVVNEHGTLHGYSTDGPGFIRSLREALDLAPRGRRFALLGAGGAAQAVAIQLALEGAAEITVLNRTLGRAEQLVALLVQRTGVKACALGVDAWPADELPAVRTALSEADVIVNATSVGMHAPDGAPSPVPAAWLRSEQCVADIVYTPARTPLLAAAESVGARVLPGLGMLVHQGAIAFEHFTGVPAPVEVMRSALDRALATH